MPSERRASRARWRVRVCVCAAQPYLRLVKAEVVGGPKGFNPVEAVTKPVKAVGDFFGGLLSPKA